MSEREGGERGGRKVGAGLIGWGRGGGRLIMVCGGSYAEWVGSFDARCCSGTGREGYEAFDEASGGE